MMMLSALAVAAVASIPNYSQPGDWAASPGRKGPSSTIPSGATPRARQPQADVFFVHPTTDRSPDSLNQDLADDRVNAWTDASVIARQASVFNGCCRVFAPRYRQSTFRSFTAAKPERVAASDLAYGDVRRAFEYFLAHQSRGRPFILAGHSQGAKHIARLIEERIDGTPLARRMVVAYVIGFNLSEGDFGKTYKHVPSCAMPTQTGCIVQWNAVLAVPGAQQRAAAEASYVERWGDDPGKRLLCINPLTFEQSRPAAPREASMGGVAGDPGFGLMRPLVARSVAARCEDGFLVVDPDPALELKPLPGGSMHYHDIGLFYADVRADTQRRVAGWFRRKPRRN